MAMKLINERMIQRQRERKRLQKITNQVLERNCKLPVSTTYFLLLFHAIKRADVLTAKHYAGAGIVSLSHRRRQYDGDLNPKNSLSSSLQCRSGKDDDGGKPRLGGGCMYSGRIIISKGGKRVYLTGPYGRDRVSKGSDSRNCTACHRPFTRGVVSNLGAHHGKQGFSHSSKYSEVLVYPADSRTPVLCMLELDVPRDAFEFTAVMVDDREEEFDDDEDDDGDTVRLLSYRLAKESKLKLRFDAQSQAFAIKIVIEGKIL
ncbi:hypothetical protein Cgig2_003979 [Carnegiea gigantea]|uniref:Uncharacterized protein n=1 Tax=Carnegiea gigantea TaxID=171969 RepID=A0A9Q1KAQ7_9CARY|nr:hypothetical protein Cgig2_003979 [Carnegiea gigantea]